MKFWKAIRCLIAGATTLVGSAQTVDAPLPPWPAAKAMQWYAQQPWLVGCNFLPSTAVNDIEMWQRDTFDAATIDRELGWAQDLGFNSVRVFINYVVWESDSAGLKQTFAQFLSLAAKHRIRVMPILFDDCFKPEPKAGRQDDPIPGEHNSQWVCSPGQSKVSDPSTWGGLEKYVRDMVGTFGQDERIVCWDLYNEPTRSLALVEATFRWARATKPVQPLTTCVYGEPKMQQRIQELSDVISFHNYAPLPSLQTDIAKYQALGRPVLCTEWMARTTGSRIESHLPYFKAQRVGCWNWGLVAGRTQTYFPWGSPKGAPEPKVWHHDLFRPDGTSYRKREILFIKTVTGRLPADALPPRKPLVTSAEGAPVAWRYTFEKPASDWFRREFADAAWLSGMAPFGREEPPINRKPRTVWTGADIWMRRECEWPAGKYTDVALRLHHDEDTEVYINGVLAVKAGGYNAGYEEYELGPEAQAALKPGRNLIAVHCHQTVGGQYLDLGIEATETQR